MKRSYIKRSQTPLKRSGRLKAGKKVSRWNSVRAQLKKKFMAAGIITCELRYAGCAFDNFLGFAHAKKRRKLTDDDLKVAILACNSCHDEIEYLSPESMEHVVNAVIADRKIKV